MLLIEIGGLMCLKNDAKYKCMNCGYRYESQPCPTQCPKCNHLYVKWMNYKEMRKKAAMEALRVINGEKARNCVNDFYE